MHIVEDYNIHHYHYFQGVLTFLQLNPEDNFSSYVSMH